MANLLTYTDKSKTIDHKLSIMLSNINARYNNGEIPTETQYYYEIKNMLSDFYKGLTRPTFKFREAVSTPISQEYNAMINEAYSDMQYVINDCIDLEEMVEQSYDDSEMSRQMMANQVSYLSRKVSSLGESIAKNQPYGTVIITESFNEYQMANTFEGLFIDKGNGMLTLQPKSSGGTTIKKIEIDNDISNGFPGNTHCADSLNGELHFVGADGLHINLNAIKDKGDGSWFEFERFKITDQVRRDCNSFGFEFEEGVSWIMDEDETLRLKVIVHLAKPTICSWVSLKPYLPDSKGVKPFIMEKCDVFTTTNNVVRACNARECERHMVFPFPPQEVTKIEFTFAQTSGNSCKVGHLYYTSANTEDMSIFQNYDYTDVFARVDGPMPSVGLIGCRYDPSKEWIIYQDTETELPDNKYAAAGLFTLPESTIDKRANYEMLDAMRYMIGICNISVNSSKFDGEGYYVSDTYEMDDTITSVTLETEEYIPGNNNEIIQYYISLNGGSVWHKIYPLHRAYEGIYKYYVNNNSIDNMLATDTAGRKTKNLIVIGDTDKIQLKIKMRSPDPYISPDDNVDAGEDVPENSVQYMTPIVYKFKLKLTVGEDTVEF